MKQRLVRQQECGHQDQSGVSFVDNARETNGARAVVEIYLNRGRYKPCLHPFDTKMEKSSPEGGSSHPDQETGKAEGHVRLRVMVDPAGYVRLGLLYI